MMNRTKRIVLALLLLAIPLLSALLAHSVLTSKARAQDPDNSDCPLSDDQARKSIQAFDKIANVFTKEPRCVNCHGAVNPFGADANRTHGGGQIDRIMKTNLATGEPEMDDEATFQQCQGCHGASSRWVIPPDTLSFVGKDALTLCKLERDFFFHASDFIGHIKHDALIQEAFTGRMGLNDLGRTLLRPPYVFARRSIPYPAPPTGVTHRDLIQMAQDWVDAQGGTFRGNLECGCKHLERTWAGTISISYTWDEEGARGVITSTANLRLREIREQPITDLTGRVIGSKSTLVHTASSISESYAGVAGTAGGNPGVACEGSGPAELSGEAGTIWRNSSGADATGVVGFSFPAEGTYSIDLNTAVGSQRYPRRCANGATHESAFTAPPIGMGVQGDPGRKIEDRGARMRGSYRGNWNAGQIQVTWDLFK